MCVVTSSGSHCSHRHPHAEATPPPEVKDDIDESRHDDGLASSSSEDAVANGSDQSKIDFASRLDRLIAFLDSYFGQVELIRPEELDVETAGISDEPAQEPDVEEIVADVPLDPNEPAEKAEEELQAYVDDVVKQEHAAAEAQIAQPRVPVIRVRLDQHVADVTVENLVSTWQRQRPSTARGWNCARWKADFVLCRASLRHTSR